MSAKPQIKSVAEENGFVRKFDFRNEEEAGASLDHNRITRNFGALLSEHFRKKQNCSCEPFMSDLPVYSRIKKGTYFPDIVVASGEVSYENCKVYQNDWESNGFKVITKQALTNPILIAEVWSEGNSEIEKKTKFEQYKAIESLQEYVTNRNM